MKFLYRDTEMGRYILLIIDQTKTHYIVDQPRFKNFGCTFARFVRLERTKRFVDRNFKPMPASMQRKYVKMFAKTED